MGKTSGIEPTTLGLSVQHPVVHNVGHTGHHLGVLCVLCVQFTWGGVKLLTHWPVLVDVLGDVSGRVVGGEEELFRFPADQDQPEIDLETQTQVMEIRIGSDETH